MPIYEYECGACGRYEVMQKITEPALKRCEKCGKPVRKLMSQSSFALKGGGWYKDLYGSSSNGKANGKSTESSGGSNSSSSDAKSDAPKSEAPKPDAPKADAPKKAEGAKKSEGKSAAA
jgi:putative FmdB family regulatory protein